MVTVRRIITALLISMTGWIFAYYSYPFFNALLTAISDTTGIFEGWTTINNIMWLGYFGIMVLWTIVAPAYTIFVSDPTPD